jgi:hypothetical protein
MQAKDRGSLLWFFPAPSGSMFKMILDRAYSAAGFLPMSAFAQVAAADATQ